MIARFARLPYWEEKERYSSSRQSPWSRVSERSERSWFFAPLIPGGRCGISFIPSQGGRIRFLCLPPRGICGFHHWSPLGRNSFFVSPPLGRRRRVSLSLPQEEGPCFSPSVRRRRRVYLSPCWGGRVLIFLPAGEERGEKSPKRMCGVCSSDFMVSPPARGDWFIFLLLQRGRDCFSLPGPRRKRLFDISPDGGGGEETCFSLLSARWRGNTKKTSKTYVWCAFQRFSCLPLPEGDCFSLLSPQRGVLLMSLPCPRKRRVSLSSLSGGGEFDISPRWGRKRTQKTSKTYVWCAFQRFHGFSSRQRRLVYLPPSVGRKRRVFSPLCPVEGKHKKTSKTYVWCAFQRFSCLPPPEGGLFDISLPWS